FELSYRDLDDPARTLFRHLGLHPGADLTVAAAAALGGLGTAEAGWLLDDLFDHHLLHEHRPGRYRMHDLVRRFARRLGELHDSEEERAAAILRLLDEYFQQARSTARFVPSATAAPPADAGGAGPPSADMYSRTLGWFKLESANLVACARYA